MLGEGLSQDPGHHSEGSLGEMGWASVWWVGRSDNGKGERFCWGWLGRGSRFGIRGFGAHSLALLPWEVKGEDDITSPMLVFPHSWALS